MYLTLFDNINKLNLLQLLCIGAHWGKTPLFLTSIQVLHGPQLAAHHLKTFLLKIITQSLSRYDYYMKI